MKVIKTFNKKITFVFLFFSFFSGILSILSPLILKDLIDAISNFSNIRVLLKKCEIYLCINLFAIIFSYISSLYFTKAQALSSYEINRFIVYHLQRVPLNRFNFGNSSYLTQIINNDSNEVVSFFLLLINNIILQSINFFFSIYILYKMNIYIALLSVLIGFLYIINFNISKNGLFNKNKELKESQSRFFENTHEQLERVEFIKFHSIQDWFISKLDDSFRILLSKALKLQKFKMAFNSIESILKIIVTCFIFIIGGSSVINKNMTIGELTVAINYFSIVTGSLLYFSQISKQYQDIKVSTNRLDEILKIPVALDGDLEIDKINKIQLIDLSFSYDNQRMLFEKLNFCFVTGKIYGIKGKNGSGKSSLINLILGLYRVNDNDNILFNNISINKLNMRKIRYHNVSYIEQKNTILPTTIMENLFLDREINIDKILKLNQTLKFDLPENLLEKRINSVVTNLSGGEKQKISILRELSKENSLIIADEPTSALDQKSCKALIEYFKFKKHDTIIIIVSHNDYILSNCDDILNL